MSLRLRISITYAVVVALVAAVLGAVLYVSMQKTLAAEMDQRLTVRADQIQRAVWPEPVGVTAAALANVDLSPMADIEAPGRYAQVLDPSGNVLATSRNLQGTPMPVDAASFQRAVAGRPTFSDAAPRSRTLRVLSVPLRVDGKVQAVLQVTQTREPFQETMAGLRRLLILLGVAALALAGFVGWFVAYRGLRPLTSISEQAAAIAVSRDFGRRLDPRPQRRDEVGRLASTIDELLAKVDETLRAHRDFVADTSHELRNPLFAIRTNIELLKRVTQPEAAEECYREALQQVERMSRLVSDLLLLAQVETGLVLEESQVNLAVLIDRAVHDARARLRGQRLVIAHVESVEVVGDQGRLEQVLANLLDNAIKHTPSGGRISVEMVQGEDTIGIAVRDTGSGIAPEHLPRIFERAYKVNPSQTEPGDSYGLGLAIVRYLVEAHGGAVSVESELGQGSCFTVWLPSTRQAALKAAKVPSTGSLLPSMSPQISSVGSGPSVVQT